MTGVLAPVGRFVDVVSADGVATVTWSRPERRNAIGLEVCQELTAALQSVAGQDDVHVVLLSSAQPPFCAGWDVSDFGPLSGAPAAEVEKFFRHGRALLGTIGELPQVTVASTRGTVLGFGCALLTRVDIAVAADDCTFGLPEVELGMPPATALPELLSVMTPRAALRWAAGGNRFDADRARADGLVTDVVPTQELERETASLAARLAAHPGGASKATKQLVRRMAGLELDRRVGLGVDSAVRRFVGQVPA